MTKLISIDQRKPKLEIKVGKCFINRSGGKYLITAKSKDKDKIIFSVAHPKNNKDAYVVGEDGRYHSQYTSIEESIYDLVKEVEVGSGSWVGWLIAAGVIFGAFVGLHLYGVI